MQWAPTWNYQNVSYNNAHLKAYQESAHLFGYVMQILFSTRDLYLCEDITFVLHKPVEMLDAQSSDKDFFKLSFHNTHRCFRLGALFTIDYELNWDTIGG